MKFQGIKPKRAGLRCEIQVMNHSGHDVLTTFDPDVEDSTEVAQADLEKFWDDCIKEHGGYKPLVYGVPQGTDGTDGLLLNPKAPDFDLGLFQTVTIMPFPVVGG